MRPFVLALLAPAALALLLAAPAGCQRHIESICRQSCECEPCTDADLDDCLERGTAAQEVAKEKDCSPKLDAYLACVDENLSCQHGAGPGTDACGKQEEELIACAGTGNPFATVCQQAAQKSAKCFGQPTPSGVGNDCPKEQECQSACILQTTCEAISGAMFDQKFQDCVNACFTK